MNENHSKARNRLEDCVVAAIDTGARLRGPQESSPRNDPVERTIAIIESEAARLRGNDFSALNAVLASQALALDTIFTQFAREAVEDNILAHHVLRLPLKAQSQSRSALDSLASFARPGALSRRSERNFDEQTGANGNHPSP